MSAIVLCASRAHSILIEKEWLLREVNHRVKNNLQTIISLLESQSAYLDKDALQAIEKSQHRIYAMSLIHQKIYQNDEVKSIDMADYLEEFINYLKKSFDVQDIDFTVDVQPIQLNLSQATPVALIINEAVTNSIKYAFPDPAGARISIMMDHTGDTVHLVIADNGKGFVPTQDSGTKSLGIQLIKGLSKEIRGTVLITGHNGTEIDVHFKKTTLSSTELIMQKELADNEP